jgi:hypothetical protein
MYAIPVSLLTWGFEAEAERCARKTRAGFKQAKATGIDGDRGYRAEINLMDSLNSDDEYLRIIAKESSASSTANEDRRRLKVKELTDKYMENDMDGQKFAALSDFLTQNRPQTGKPESDCTIHDLASDAPDLKQRIGALEASVENINSKLDRLCKMLESRP